MAFPFITDKVDDQLSGDNNEQMFHATETKFVLSCDAFVNDFENYSKFHISYITALNTLTYELLDRLSKVSLSNCQWS